MANNFLKNNYTVVLGPRSNTGPGPWSAKSGWTRPGPDCGQSSGDGKTTTYMPLASLLTSPNYGMEKLQNVWNQPLT